jgi:hypothetical protein
MFLGLKQNSGGYKLKQDFQGGNSSDVMANNTGHKYQLREKKTAHSTL